MKGYISMDNRKKVLIVEDESLTAMMLEEYVENKGFRSLGLSATGEEAIRKAQEENPDLVFMDFRLSGEMNGIEAAKLIDAEGRIPIVIMTGYDKQIVLERASEYQPRAILRKPLDDAEIDAVLKSIA